MPQTRFVTAQGAGAGPAADPGRQQDRPRRLRSRGHGRRDLRSVLRAGRDRRAARLPDRLRLGPRGLGGARTSTDERKDLAPLLDLIVEKVPPPAGRRRRAAGDARDDARLRRLPRLRRHRPHRVGAHQAGRPRAAASHRDGTREEFRVAEAARLPVAQALRAGRGRRRRHLRRHRHAGPDRRRDHHRDRAPDRAAAARDRRADGQDAVHVQQRSVRRQGGQVRHLAQPARPPVQGDEVERRAARRGDRVARHLRGARAAASCTCRC